MKKRPKPQRRIRHPWVKPGARVIRVMPDPEFPHVVEVRLSRTRAAMRAEMERLDRDGRGQDRRCMGLVRSWHNKIDKRPVIRPGMLVARVYLNVADLREKPSEIVAHEATHAGMAWARMRRANLHRMVGEEVLCHATGRMVAQLNRALYAAKVW